MPLRPGDSVKIPSPIDIHSHLREPGGERQETIASGTLATLCGGYQAVFDMPNNPTPNQTWSSEKLHQKINIANHSANTNIGFYAGVDINNPNLEEVGSLATEAAGLKLYMDHTTNNDQKYDLDSVREIIDTWVNGAAKVGKKPPILLHARNEVGAETASYIAKKYPIHWCHIASEVEVDYARKLTKKYPDTYSGGVTPHHLTMTERNADFQQGWNARMQPPLGQEIDADALLDAYNKSDIQILETDHAPHLEQSKFNAERRNPLGNTDVTDDTCYGVSGIEFVLPVMMSLVMRRKISLERLVDSLYNQPIKTLGLKSSDSTQSITNLLIDPYTIEKEAVVGQSFNTPYIGWTAWAKVSRVIVDNLVKLEMDENQGILLSPQEPPAILSYGSIVGAMP